MKAGKEVLLYRDDAGCMCPVKLAETHFSGLFLIPDPKAECYDDIRLCFDVPDELGQSDSFLELRLPARCEPVGDGWKLTQRGRITRKGEA
jgi:hypothetical protein